MRVRFNEIFQENEQGMITPKQRIRVGGISFGPGVSFGAGVAFGGVNFHEYKGHDLEVEERDGVVVIKGIY